MKKLLLGSASIPLIVALLLVGVTLVNPSIQQTQDEWQPATDRTFVRGVYGLQGRTTANGTEFRPITNAAELLSPLGHFDGYITAITNQWHGPYDRSYYIKSHTQVNHLTPNDCQIQCTDPQQNEYGFEWTVECKRINDITGDTALNLCDMWVYDVALERKLCTPETDCSWFESWGHVDTFVSDVVRWGDYGGFHQVGKTSGYSVRTEIGQLRARFSLWQPGVGYYGGLHTSNDYRTCSTYVYSGSHNWLHNGICSGVMIGL